MRGLLGFSGLLGSEEKELELSGGRWVEVDESNNGDANALNVKRANAEALHREQQRMTTGPGGLGGTVGNGTGP